MTKVPIDDREVLTVMKDGTMQLCDFAKDRWYSGKYSSCDVQENVERWDRIAQRATELIQTSRGCPLKHTHG